MACCIKVLSFWRALIQIWNHQMHYHVWSFVVKFYVERSSTLQMHLEICVVRIIREFTYTLITSVVGEDKTKNAFGWNICRDKEDCWCSESTTCPVV